MQPSAHEGIAHSYRIYHIGDIDDRSLKQSALSPEECCQCVMAGAYYVSHSHHPVFQTGILGMKLIKPLAILIHLHLEVRVSGGEWWLWML